MKIKQVAMIVSGVGGVMALTVAFMLWREIQSFRKAERDLTAGEKNLATYYRMDPFPSNENVTRERENLDKLETWRKTLVAELRKGGIRTPETTAARFSQMLFEKRAALIKLAENSGTSLVGGDKFAFGFEEYATGHVPAPEDVPRLTEQLLVTEILSRMLFEENVKSVVRIGREKADGEARTRVRQRPQAATAPVPTDPSGSAVDNLREKNRYVLEFTAREQAVMRFLNQVAAHSAFMAVARLEMETLDSDIRKPNVPGPTDPTERMKMKLHAHPRRTDRMVAGRVFENLVRVKVELDVYRFKGDA